MRRFSNNDLYTYTVKRVVWEHFPNVSVEYAFRNRDHGVDLLPFKERIREKIGELHGIGPTERTLDKLRDLGYFPEPFLEALRNFRLNSDHVTVGERDGKIDIRIRGAWFETIDFEVPVLQLVNEAVYEGTVSLAVRNEGDRRLTAKIDRLRTFAREEVAEPNSLRIVDMGTRRAYSHEWHGNVLRRLAAELPEVFAGTSNVYWGEELGLSLYGTFSHQGPMAMQALTPIQDSQRRWFGLWAEVYGGKLGIALSDTLGWSMFRRDFDSSMARLYDGARQDSGDPLAWGERFISHLESLGIDPRTKLAVFSDSLTDERAVEIWRRFAGRIGVQFGIGTYLTNDLGQKPMSNVIKLVRCNGYPVAKLSDTPEKAQCEDPAYLAYLLHLVNDIVPKAG
ncbi:nicotinate phosphoribosyltransferase [Fimbriimonas ginsengisoli]|uniref:Nicotinate phosphoribosyltransferase n=1 Tax=Fimbriimonas ginsengisoli Gsoil 348 TaxID=661478 RepID=A0A068NX21_FIMGI|nr:nicotinate phosphoribosyltransferase [Fimbriimonas ginsengisoli]AIE87986.1 nicotinate phosphoribosyltransferase [Fimbriimonas ginsengisoli Gsoil 348]